MGAQRRGDRDEQTRDQPGHPSGAEHRRDHAHNGDGEIGVRRSPRDAGTSERVADHESHCAPGGRTVGVPARKMGPANEPPDRPVVPEDGAPLIRQPDSRAVARH
ncbi:hypothetical protein CH260_03835 [Rhodococcus sp. 05-2256-B2]|nr:hypothetical protein CH258_23365 [Rhodococcus sp. 05-2256-B4]OZD94021.1 hypothetical protein CH257_11245 [Rhodococcus sp. 05-2256-B3]OZE01119.1 hypothetical protein CH260_03835 [Rhodococcus sp. 05-2256-B2]OZE04723.1 hypothetical protein CH285_09995 [Rhodococcus sp. 05-2256-B1]